MNFNGYNIVSVSKISIFRGNVFYHRETHYLTLTQTLKIVYFSYTRVFYKTLDLS